MPHWDIELRRRCERVLDDVDLPRPFTVERLCRQLGEQRGRPLHLHALPLQAAKSGACGLWVATDTDDHFFIQPKTARMHRDHIVLHEIGHMLFDHDRYSSDQSQISALLTDLSPHLIQRLLARTDYSTVHEQEAEMLASLIRTRAHPNVPALGDGVLANLQASLGLGERRA